MLFPSETFLPHGSLPGGHGCMNGGTLWNRGYQSLNRSPIGLVSGIGRGPSRLRSAARWLADGDLTDGSLPFNHTSTIRQVGSSSDGAGRHSLIVTALCSNVQTKGLFSEMLSTKGWIMSGIKRVLFSQSESGLFNQTALFCVVGLCISLALVLVSDLEIAAAWI
jgi:hypothetical protein